MRKNRANNGYIGAAPILNRFNENYSGSLTSSKQHLNTVYEDKMLTQRQNPIYIRPSNGNGYGASAFASLTGGVLSNLSFIIPGGSYSFFPIVTIGGAGGGPTCYGVVTKSGGYIKNIEIPHKISSVSITDPGLNYTAVPAVAFSAPNRGGTGLGSGYIIDNILTITGFTSGLFVPGQLITGSSISANTIILDYLSGTGTTGTYILNNTQTFATGGISGIATARGIVSLLNNRIAGVSLTYVGTNYTKSFQPTVSFSGTPERTAVGIANYEPVVNGYTYAPSVSFSGGVTAQAKTFILATLGSITIATGGFNYTSEPTVFVDGFEYRDNLEPLFTSSISSGAVTAVNFNPLDKIIASSKFTDPPEVIIGGWNPMPVVSDGENKIVGIGAVWNVDSNFYTISLAGVCYQVDWGDGTTSGHTSGSVAYKQYGSSVYSGLTMQDPFRGYKTVTITATPLVSGNFTTLTFPRHIAPSSTSFASGMLDLTVAGPTLSTITIMNANGLYHRILENIDIRKNLATGYNLQGALGLKKAKIDCISLTTLSQMFNNCPLLHDVTLNNTQNVTSTNQTFAQCRSLVSAPFFDTSNVTTTGSMFSASYRIYNVPLYDLRKCTNASSMFSGCYGLEYVPQFDLSSCTDMSAMFSNCINLISIPPFNTSKCTNFSYMFQNTKALKTIPLLDTSNGTNFSFMFSASGVQYVPNINTSRGTDFNNMFYNAQVITVPELDTSKGLDFTNMFNNTISLGYIPYIDTSEGTTFNGMFNSANGIRAIPKINTSNGRDFGSMFASCFSLTTIPNLNTEKGINYVSMFSNCSSLGRVPSLVLGATYGVGNINTGLTLLSTAFNTMFSSCTNLREIPPLNFAGSTGPGIGVNIFTNIFASTTNIHRIGASGFYHSFTIPGPGLGATQLNEIYTNLPVVGVSGGNVKTITVTGNWGLTLDTPMIAISKGWAVSG